MIGPAKKTKQTTLGFKPNKTSGSDDEESQQKQETAPKRKRPIDDGPNPKRIKI